MIPREKVDTPGYEVDSVYKPATEVGGDFFTWNTRRKVDCWWSSAM